MSETQYIEMGVNGPHEVTQIIIDGIDDGTFAMAF
jgi:hypothetical protein